MKRFVREEEVMGWYFCGAVTYRTFLFHPVLGEVIRAEGYFTSVSFSLFFPSSLASKISYYMFPILPFLSTEHWSRDTFGDWIQKRNEFESFPFPIPSSYVAFLYPFALSSRFLLILFFHHQQATDSRLSFCLATSHSRGIKSISSVGVCNVIWSQNYQRDSLFLFRPSYQKLVPIQ